MLGICGRIPLLTCYQQHTLKRSQFSGISNKMSSQTFVIQMGLFFFLTSSTLRIGSCKAKLSYCSKLASQKYSMSVPSIVPEESPEYSLSWPIVPLSVHQITFECLPNVPWVSPKCSVFTECSLIVPWLSPQVFPTVFTDCPQSVPWVFLECLLSVPWVSPECSLSVPWVPPSVPHMI